MLVVCANPACQKPFKARPTRSKKGQCRYCSKACYWACFVPKTLEERFWSKVDKTSSPDGCWLWIGNHDNRSGYGLFALPDANPKRWRVIEAHRMSYILRFGSIPDGLWVLHKPPCFTRLCVRHIYAGTPQDNSDDTGLLGRRAQGPSHGAAKHPENWARGERHYHVKLTDPEINAIRGAYTGAHGEQTALARQYHTSQSNIWAIVNNKTRL